MEKGGDGTERRSKSTSTHPYSLWMIATRRQRQERRQQGRPAGQGHPVDAAAQGLIGGHQKEIHTGNEKEKEALKGRRSTGSSSRRAAEEDEHVVIRGAQGGKVINTTVVHTGDTAATNIPVMH
nr:uncharacterized protein LOC109158503 [Ipomoea batatas]